MLHLCEAPADAALDKGVAEAEGGGPKGVGHRGVHGVVVAAVVATR